MPHHNSPHAQLPLRSLRTTEPILEDFATSATISYLPANRSVPTVVKGWKDYASQGAQQWERHRDIIKSLYIDERKGLKDVMEIMKLDHGFVAT